jgi:hypothetical protein
MKRSIELLGDSVLGMATLDRRLHQAQRRTSEVAHPRTA